MTTPRTPKEERAEGLSIHEMLAAIEAKRAAMPPEERAKLEADELAAQRESWIRAMGPCEHGDYDWETCPDCLARIFGDHHRSNDDG